MSDADDVASALDERPGASAVEVRDTLRARGRVSVTVADVDRELVALSGRFHPDDRDPPGWWPGPGDETRDLAGTRRTTIHAPPERIAATRTAAPARAAPPVSVIGEQLPSLYTWQADALEAWRRRGSRGVIEAVTGTGKTMVGVAASIEELGRGGQVCVVVPTEELQRQWHQILADVLPRHTSIGRLGGGHRDSLGHHDVLVSIVNSARTADLSPRRPGGLLVADECHRYGSDGNRLALELGFTRRLGLSATYARADDGHLAWLDPYFGGTCFRMDHRRATADGITARFTVALVGVAFTPEERSWYDELTLAMATGRSRLIAGGWAPAEPIGAFLAAVSRLARRADGSDASLVAAVYLRNLADRRALLADTPAKEAMLAELAPSVRSADRVLVFTQTIAAAERAAAVLRATGVRAAAVHSESHRVERRAALARFAAGEITVLAAPQILDEGIDVPAADLAIILSASQSPRQMVQRMGRVLRRKPDRRRARFVVIGVEGTIEDPDRGGHGDFLAEVTDVAEEARRFTSGDTPSEIRRFVDQIWGWEGLDRVRDEPE